MATDLKRMTFSVTPEIEAPLKKLKKEIFYDRSQSDMIRTLVSLGIRALEVEKKKAKVEK